MLLEFPVPQVAEQIAVALEPSVVIPTSYSPRPVLTAAAFPGTIRRRPLVPLHRAALPPGEQTARHELPTSCVPNAAKENPGSTQEYRPPWP